MRKLILMVQLSVDGYMSEKDGNTNWMVYNWGSEWTWDDELRKYFINLTASTDCILLSRKMAVEGYFDYWAGVAADTGLPQSVFAKNIVAAHKVVFTKTLEQSVWDNADLAKGDLKKEVKKLKKQEGKNMMVYGGATFVSVLIEAGLIDEYQLFINPTALGSGTSIFKKRTNLQLVNERSFVCGVTVLKYEKPKINSWLKIA
jgi:dihydrofolate reductase